VAKANKQAKAPVAALEEAENWVRAAIDKVRAAPAADAAALSAAVEAGKEPPPETRQVRTEGERAERRRLDAARARADFVLGELAETVAAHLGAWLKRVEQASDEATSAVQARIADLRQAFEEHQRHVHVERGLATFDAESEHLSFSGRGRESPEVAAALAELERLATAHVELRPVEPTPEEQAEAERLKGVQRAYQQMSAGGIYAGRK
jgi:hypothetical protein